MSWPPVTGTAFLLDGMTSIKWGTDGILTGNANAIGNSYIVKSIRNMDAFETIYIENGFGLRATRVGLIQGREVELTVVDDTSFNPPTYDSQITMVDTLSGATLIFRVIDNSYNAARKQEGDRVMRCVFDTLIEGAGTIPPRVPPP